MPDKSDYHISLQSWNSVKIIQQAQKNVNIVELHERNIFCSHIIIVELREFYREGAIMRLNDAIVKRIYEVCEERSLNICDACLKGGMSPSAIYDLVKGRTKCSKVITLQHFCEGAGITLKDFFDRDYFNSVDD